MTILTSNERLILGQLLELKEISDLANSRKTFWKKHVDNTVIYFKGIETFSKKKVDLSTREYVSFAVSSIEINLIDLPKERNLITTIKALEHSDNIKSKIVFNDLKELVIHIDNGFNLERKILFLFLADTYEQLS